MNKLKSGILNIFSWWFQKNKFEIFEQEMRKIFEIFPIIFDQKSQNHVIWSSKEQIKNMWSLTRKVFERKIFFKTLTFHVGDQIFFICYLKNHMTWFCDFWSKIFGNILKIFLIFCSKIFKLIFLVSSVKNIENATIYFIQICTIYIVNNSTVKFVPV